MKDHSDLLVLIVLRIVLRPFLSCGLVRVTVHVTKWGGQLLAATRNNVITCDYTKQRRKRTFRSEKNFPTLLHVITST